MKNLENFGVQEMSAKEIRETVGGGLFAALLIAVVVFGLSKLSKKKNVNVSTIGYGGARSYSFSPSKML